MTKTVQEMIAVMQAYADGKPVEYRHVSDSIWNTVSVPMWNWIKFDYRIATIPDSIDWSHVSPKYVCMARNDYGEVRLFSASPRVSGYVWQGHGFSSPITDHFASYRRGTVDWKDSLVFRPGHEPKEDAA